MSLWDRLPGPVRVLVVVGGLLYFVALPAATLIRLWS